MDTKNIVKCPVCGKPLTNVAVDYPSDELFFSTDRLLFSTNKPHDIFIFVCDEDGTKIETTSDYFNLVYHNDDGFEYFSMERKREPVFEANSRKCLYGWQHCRTCKNECIGEIIKKSMET